MKFSKISLYAFIFAIFAIFIKLMVQTYLNFFNKNQENEIIQISLLQKVEIKPECELILILPNRFSGEMQIKASFKPECEDEVFNLISHSFKNSKAQKKFLKLANKNSNSEEITKRDDTTYFNVQTASVEIKRIEKTEITITNLNKKHV